MRGLWAACLLVGCAQGRGSYGLEDIDAGTTPGPDARTWRDGAIEQPTQDAFVAPPADAPPDSPPQIVCNDVQLLQNPVLDLNPLGMGWVQQNIDNAAPIITADDGIAEHSAPFKAWMGGFAGEDLGASSLTDVLYQDFVVPANTTQLRVTGVYDIRTLEYEGYAYDSATVALTQTNGTPIQTLLSVTNLTAVSTWTPLDVMATQNLAGQTVRLRLASTNDVWEATSFYFDTLAVTATVCQ